MIRLLIKLVLVLLVIQVVVAAAVAMSARNLFYSEWDMLAFLPGNNPAPAVHLLDVDHGITYPLPTVPGTHSTPTWSPDGRYLAFVVNDIRIYLFDSRTYETQRLTIPGQTVSAPTWMPDSQHLIVKSFNDGVTGIYMMDISGQDAEQVIEDGRGIDFLTLSPDGKQFAWVQYAGLESGYEIFVRDRETGETRQMTSGSDTDVRHNPIHWSPDSGFLAYMSETQGLRWITVLNVESGEVQRLLRVDTYNAQPEWSLDGSKLAFWIADNPLQSTLFMMDVDGENLERLVTLQPQINLASWRR